MATGDTAELLSQLKGIHLPEAPVAPSLWPVYLSVAVCVVTLTVWLFKRLGNHGEWKKEALLTLDKIQTHSAPDAVPQTAALLKRIALTHDADKPVRHLHGEPWLNYLDEFYQTDFFSQGDGRIFGNALYQHSRQPDERLYKKLHRLIKRHKRPQ